MALIVAIVAGALISIIALRNKEIEDWRRNLGGMSFMVAENTSQTVFSAYLVLDSITERVRQSGVGSDAEFRARLSTPEIHQMLRERIQGLPQVDVASLVAANGDNINFSRSYPVPPINLAERDYFKAHQNNPSLGDFISTAVRNKGNGKWTFYVSRRLNDARGRFMGLVLVGLSVDALTGVYDRVTTGLGDGASITLYRSDLTSLARSPRKDEVIGKVNETGSTHWVIDLNKKNEAVVMVDTPRFSTGQKELRLSAVRRVERYPLIMSLVVPEGIFLAGWRRSALLIAGSGLLSIGFILVGITVLTRSAARREQTARELRDSETKFHTMVDWATDWEYWLHPDGRVHYMTPSAEQHTGYRVEEFEQDPTLIDQVIHPDDRARWRSHLDSIHAHADPSAAHGVDLRIVQKSGRQRWVSHVSRPVFGSAGYLGRRSTVRDITERKASEDEIRQLAYYDALTQLPNRRLFLDRLSHALMAAERSQQFGAVLMLDLDHFKKLNDTQGHDVGDRLLLEVAQRLTLALREVDTIARLGGDEFAVMIEGLGGDASAAARQAAHIAEKIHARLNQPYSLDGAHANYCSSPSIGMTLFRGRAAPIDVLLKQADVALYQAKDAGRNTIRFFNPTMQADIDSRTAMEGALRQALVENRFQLYYQPQVDEHGERTGAEALIRWFDATGKMTPPDQFIPLAEETGLILDIGQWVLDTACAQLRRWQDEESTRHLRMSVNVSARQFHQPDFVDRVRRSLTVSGAHPSQLMLELTESIVVDRLDDVIERMKALRELGVLFSLDDFGTGYSSLSYVKRLPLDEVKIDRSFVRDLVVDSNDAAIVRAILAMSESLGLRVVAEGVETQVQRDFLLRNGCRAYQGYLFGRPMPISAWEAVPA
ncbi:MAG TPA: EAL domain-containing protein [Burkholderiaceae bacterium]|nr:EAL domain-containing protein [Burkholderiaceae bacterium]